MRIDHLFTGTRELDGARATDRSFVRCCLLAVVSFLFLHSRTFAQVERVWLTHRSNDPSKLVVNWTTKRPGHSVVRFGVTGDDEQTARREGNTTLHHVDIPLPKKDVVYHYSVSTGTQSSTGATFKGYPTDELRVAVAANWQRKADLTAIVKDNVHLLLTAGDNISSIHGLCGAGKQDCIKPYAELIDRYPDLFRAVPFMPALGNHDREIRPRGSKPPAQPVYDINATAFRSFFDLPGDEWKWCFDVPAFDVRFVALDFNHISDFGTTWQSCHSWKQGSPQYNWYRDLVAQTKQQFVVTLYNERNSNIRQQEGRSWHKMLSRGTIAIAGFGYFAERAEVGGFSYYNTSLSGKGARYPDPKSAFLKSEDNYILLTFTTKPPRMVVKLKSLNSAVMDQRIFGNNLEGPSSSGP